MFGMQSLASMLVSGNLPESDPQHKLGYLKRMRARFEENAEDVQQEFFIVIVEKLLVIVDSAEETMEVRDQAWHCLNTAGLRRELEDYLANEIHALGQFLQYVETFPSKTGRLCSLSILCASRETLVENGNLGDIVPYVPQVYRIMRDSDPDIVKKISYFLSYYICAYEDEMASERICRELISQGIFARLYELFNSDEEEKIAALYLARAFATGLYGKFVPDLIDAGLMSFIRSLLLSNCEKVQKEAMGVASGLVEMNCELCMQDKELLDCLERLTQIKPTGERYCLFLDIIAGLLSTKNCSNLKEVVERSFIDFVLDNANNRPTFGVKAGLTGVFHSLSEAFRIEEKRKPRGTKRNVLIQAVYDKGNFNPLIAVSKQPMIPVKQDAYGNQPLHYKKLLCCIDSGNVQYLPATWWRN